MPQTITMPPKQEPCCGWKGGGGLTTLLTAIKPETVQLIKALQQ